VSFYSVKDTTFYS